MLRLNEFRQKARGLADVLNIALMPSDGVLQNKDGSLTAGWRYRGHDLASATHAEMAAVSDRLNVALRALGSGWMLHCDAVRIPATRYPEAGAFPDRTSWLIDHECRVTHESEGRYFETEYVLTLTYLPPLRQTGRLIDMLYEDELRDRSAQGYADRVMAKFQVALTDFETMVGNSLALQRLRAEPQGLDHRGRPVLHDALLQHMEFCISGVRRPVRTPTIPMYLDALIGAHDFAGGMAPRVGTKTIRVVAIDGFPQDSYPGILHVLDQFSAEYRWSTRFIFLDPPQARRAVEATRRRWAQKQRGLKDQVFNTAGGTLDLDAVEMTQDAERAVGDIESNAVAFGYYTSCVVLMHDDPRQADELAQQVRKAVLAWGFGARVEDINSVEAWLGSIPGHGHANVRRPMMHTLNLADLLPISAAWPGPAENPCPFYPPHSPPLAYARTLGSTPFRLSLHVGDVGHTLMVGKTGGGKSAALGFMAAQQLRYPDAQVFVFDKGYSAYILCHAVGGAHVDIGGEGSTLAFCPLGQIDSDAERAWAAEWIETLVELQGLSVTPDMQQTIFQAIRRLAQSHSRTLTEFVSELQDEALRAALAHYTLAGPMGHLLDATHDGLTQSHFQVFEMEHIMAMGPKNLVPVLLYLFRQVERRLDGRPTLVLLDECWLMLSNDMFRERIRDWLKTWRKKNAAVVLATQELADVMASPIRDAIIASTPVKLLLPNVEARDASSRGAYEQLGLNPREIDLLAGAAPKRDYYYKSPLGRRMFSFNLQPATLSFVGVSSQDDLREVRRLMAREGGQWPAAWLRQRGLAEWGDLWAR